MTVSSSTDRATFPGNGVTIVFPLPFRFFANTEVEASLIDDTTGAVTPLSIGTHYTLTGAGLPEQDGNADSELTMITAPIDGVSLFVQRVLPLTQSTDIVNQGQFHAEIHEIVFDRLTMLIQQGQGQLDRAIRVADSDPSPSPLPPVVQREGKLLSFDALGNPIAVAPIAQSATDLELRLRDPSDLANGAAIVARGLQSFSTVAAMISAAANIAVGQSVITSSYAVAGDGGGAVYAVMASSSEPSILTVSLGVGKIAVIVGREVSPLQVGYSLNASALDTPAKVAENWAIMKALIAAAKSTSRVISVSKPVHTLRSICAEWLARRSAPVGFYSDSTTDGATTTDHVASTGTDSPFAVTINESPNAYPANLQSYLKTIIGSDKTVVCYNGGFDSQSFQNGFGLKHWYNTWFRAAGSNMAWTDVKMIVIGFGTSDSINLNDPASVIDAYSIDVECTVIDCLLRGVSPVLQGPVLTTQKVGTTVDYRNGNESITIIESIQKQICGKYGLEFVTYRDEVQELISGYVGFKYSDYMAADMIHPTDMGHRIHAGYLISKFFPNLGRVKPGAVEHFFSGNNAYITTASEIISPPSQNGQILRNISGVQSDDAYFYSWRAVDGNDKDPGDLLVRLPIYADRPCNLYINSGRNNLPAARVYSINQCTLGTYLAGSILDDVYAQPALTWNKRRFIARLTYGLNIVEFRVADAASAGDYQFVSAYLVDGVIDPMFIPARRQSGSGTYAYKKFEGLEVFTTYGETGDRDAVRPWMFYNQHDGVQFRIGFDLYGAFAGGITYQFKSHHQDGTARKNCYNKMSILGDNVSVAVVNNGVETNLNTLAVAGLNALLVAGANVQIGFSSNFTGAAGITVKLYVNWVEKYTFTAALGALFSDGYGFESVNALRSGEKIVCTHPVPVDTSARYYL